MKKFLSPFNLEFFFQIPKQVIYTSFYKFYYLMPHVVIIFSNYLAF